MGYNGMEDVVFHATVEALYIDVEEEGSKAIHSITIPGSALVFAFEVRTPYLQALDITAVISTLYDIHEQQRPSFIDLTRSAPSHLHHPAFHPPSQSRRKAGKNKQTTQPNQNPKAPNMSPPIAPPTTAQRHSLHPAQKCVKPIPLFPLPPLYPTWRITRILARRVPDKPDIAHVPDGADARAFDELVADEEGEEEDGLVELFGFG
ncbi:MAG: hypothetical protein Q9207_005683 [Kuettlingeria erythrocarpa]